MRNDPLAIPVSKEDADAIPWPSATSHKHSRGRLAVIAGGPLNTGAARLAARAGQRIGAGWVSLFGSQASCQIMAAHETSILICQRVEAKALSREIENFDAAILGPAFGLDQVRQDDVIDVVSHYKGALVLDADALHHIACVGEAAFAGLKARGAPAVLTPHSGEFARLFGAVAADGKGSQTLNAAQKSGCIIVHKGASTVIATPTGEVFTSSIVAPFLASAGTGDVLAGMIGGLLAQGMTGIAACKAAVWLHSTLGNRLGAGLIAEDLTAALPALLSEIVPQLNGLPGRS